MWWWAITLDVRLHSSGLWHCSFVYGYQHSQGTCCSIFGLEVCRFRDRLGYINKLHWSWSWDPVKGGEERPHSKPVEGSGQKMAPVRGRHVCCRLLGSGIVRKNGSVWGTTIISGRKLEPWRWRKYIGPKCHCSVTWCHDQQTTVSVIVSVRASRLTNLLWDTCSSLTMWFCPDCSLHIWNGGEAPLHWWPQSKCRV